MPVDLYRFQCIKENLSHSELLSIEKIAPSGGRRENIWGISCEKSRFYAKKSYFFQF